MDQKLCLGLLLVSSACSQSEGLPAIANASDVNVPAPADYSGRVIYADSAAVRNDLPDFVGHVVEIAPDGSSRKLRLERFVKDDVRPPVEPVDMTSGQLYHSKIDRTFKSSSSAAYILGSIGVDLSSEDMLEVTIRDVAVAALKSRQIDTKALVELAKTPNNSGGLRCFVQGVRVASIIYKKFSRIGVDASIAVSELFKSGNSYFGSSNAFSGDFKLSLDCIDLDVLAPKVSGSQLEESDEDLLADPDRFRPARGRLAVGALPTR